MQLLAKHKVLTSTKGPHGGFGLGKKAEEITLYDIVTIIDSDDVFTTCLISLNSCEREDIVEKHCPVHKDFDPIRQQIISFFKDKNIQELVYNVKRDKNILL